MGYHEDDKPRLDKQIGLVNEGDVLIVKSYGTTAQPNYYIRAIGIVSSKNKPLDIPDEYQDRPGFSVIWIKYFENPIPLSASEYHRGGVHTYTIHQECNEKLIAKIKEMMKYDYIKESEENESENLAFVIPDEEYIEIAKIFVLEDAYSTYNEEDVFEYPDEDIEIKAQDSYERKIVCVPFEAEEMTVYGLVLLVPEKDLEDDSFGLANRCIMFSEDESNLSELIEEMKAQIDWDKSL